MIYLAIRLAAQFVSQFPGTIGLGVDSLNLLTDAQMREFIVNGFVTVQTDFPPKFHATVRAQAESIFSTEGNPGNDILPRIPELAELFAHPAVTGALTSILGPGYAMHAHRHWHLTPPRQPAQRQLQDSYEDDRNVRHHRTRWAMAFYYPSGRAARDGADFGVARFTILHQPQPARKTGGVATLRRRHSDDRPLRPLASRHDQSQRSQPLHDEVSLLPHVRTDRTQLELP